MTGCSGREKGPTEEMFWRVVTHLREPVVEGTAKDKGSRNFEYERQTALPGQTPCALF